ncbi:MAG: pyridoxamine 5'-phosphate oxidase family protein [Desulfobacteraceae bacterium]|jgi:nitroimidazol reductase NimA-like FMN-containing flavoprotein (pyridoxamine 5'-phosphate oxidase superfamily)
MKGEVKIRKRLKDLLNSQKLGVLATHSKRQPYASLVAIVATEDLKHLLFATTRSTRKYENLARDPRVAVLVDSRSNQDADIHNAMAATATGGAEEVPQSEREAYLEIYLSKHPHLKDFVSSPTCALIRVKVDTYFLVSRFQRVLELHIQQ